MKRYEVNGWTKDTDEDNFENGCTGDGQSYSGNEHWHAETIEKLIEQLKNFCGDVSDDSVMIDTCGEDGRVDIQKQENENGDTPTAEETRQWEKGKAKQWLATYSFQVEEVERNTVSLAPLVDKSKKYEIGG